MSRLSFVGLVAAVLWAVLFGAVLGVLLQPARKTADTPPPAPRSEFRASIGGAR